MHCRYYLDDISCIFAIGQVPGELRLIGGGGSYGRLQVSGCIHQIPAYCDLLYRPILVVNGLKYVAMNLVKMKQMLPAISWDTRSQVGTRQFLMYH